MKRIFSFLLIFIISFSVISCADKQIDAEDSTYETIASKPEGFVYLNLDPYPTSTRAPITEEYPFTIHYGHNKEYDKNTTAKIVIMSDEIEISKPETVVDNFESDRYEKENDATISFKFSPDTVNKDIGEIKFEIQVLDQNGKVSDFANRTIYYATTKEFIYLSGNSLEDVERIAKSDQKN